jgi:hypothetical protein
VEAACQIGMDGGGWGTCWGRTRAPAREGASGCRHWRQPNHANACPLISDRLAQVATSSSLKGLEINSQEVPHAVLSGLTELRVLRLAGWCVTEGALAAILPRGWVLSTLSLSLPHLRWLQLNYVDLSGRSLILQVAPLMLWYSDLLSQLAPVLPA